MQQQCILCGSSENLIVCTNGDCFCPECADEVRKSIPKLVFQCVVCGQSKKLEDLNYEIEGARPLYPSGDCFCYGDCTNIYQSSEIHAEMQTAMTVCKGCNKAIDEDEVGWCTYCLSQFCYECEKNGVGVNCCQEALNQNQILDAEEAAASIRELELLWLFSL
jgi:hypothetical protein